MTYWLFRPQPAPESDSRDFRAPVYAKRARELCLLLTGDPGPERTLLHPPPIGTVLPLIPLTAVELQAALALPEEESRMALLRCLDYFEAVTRSADDDAVVQLCFGVGAAAERQVLSSDALSLSLLQEAAAACITQAVLDSTDASGASSRAFCSWLATMDAEMALIRRWRARVPRFASVRHDALATACFLLWKNPSAHGVTWPLTKKRCNALVAELGGATEPSVLHRVTEELVQHAPGRHVTDLLAELERWFELGDGCTVVSHRPPELVGAVPHHLSAIWSRVPKLVEYGLLRHE